MAPLFGPSLEERARLVHALRTLENTSISGLAAALSWSPRRTERIVEQLARRGEGGVYYSPRLGQVRYGPPPAPEAVARPPEPVPRTPPPPALPHAATPIGPSASVSVSTEPAASCPRCHTRMQSTVSGEALVCPACGRLALTHPSPPKPSAPKDPPGSGDRRAQEMLASYVTSRPLTCSRCRSPLRHEGVAAFRCPACGQSVRFEAAPSRPPLPKALAPPAP